MAVDPGTEPRRRAGSLTKRERQILGLLAQGLSGADIATQLVLSPETVRTHVRNAMTKLGATTRSQAVVLALSRGEIDDAGTGMAGAGAGAEKASPRPAPRPAAAVAEDVEIPLEAMLGGITTLYDVDGGAVFLAEEDGLSLRLGARSNGEGPLLELPDSLALGEGALGRAALERRAQLIALSGPQRLNGAAGHPTIVAPMLAAGRLVGLLCLAVRASRPTGRGELLLVQAFAARIAEILAAGGDQLGPRLDRALDRFRTSWTATTSA
jgi:DNA-binding CsgD family transcriptional regulator